MVALVGGFAAALWWVYHPATPHADTAQFVTRKAGIELAAGFVSYTDVATTQATYPRAVTLTDIRRPATDAHPPRALVTLELRPFNHLDSPGRLTLDFFNDRLMEVTFYPDNATAYAPSLAHAEPRLRRQGANRQVTVSGHRRVAANIAQQAGDLGPSMGARAFVLWQDLRLRAELDTWDARFGHLPQPMDRKN